MTEMSGVTGKKFIAWMGVAAYLFLLLFAVIFCKERIVMSDASFQFFSILREGDFAIQIQRFGAVFTQVIPLLASKLGLPFSYVGLSYSLCFIIFYFVCFLIVLFVFKNDKIALCILLFNTLLVRHSFYWIQCEFVQGAVFTLVYIAITEFVIKKDKVPLWYYVFTPLFLLTILYFYPLLLFIMLFGVFFLLKEYSAKRKLLLTVISIYAVMFIVKKIFFDNYYDARTMKGVENIITKFPDYFQLNSFKNFYDYVLHDYYLLPLMWIFTSIFLILQKKYFHLFWMSAFLLGVCFLINVNYEQGTEQFYIESQYLILSIFVAMPFAYHILSHKKYFIPAAVIVIAVLSISLLRIPHTAKKYKQRVQYIRTLANESPTKRIVPKEKQRPDVLKLTWAISFETWVLSMLEKNKTISVVYEENPGQFSNELPDRKIFLTNLGKFDYVDINGRYFTKDTSTTYTIY